MVRANKLQRGLLLTEETGDRRLLIPGWGGDLRRGEVAFVLQSLLMDPGLSRRWGFSLSSNQRPEPEILERAMQG
jgi:hypothetical protein